MSIWDVIYKLDNVMSLHLFLKSNYVKLLDIAQLAFTSLKKDNFWIRIFKKKPK